MPPARESVLLANPPTPTPHPRPPQLLLVASASALVAKAPASARAQTRVASAAVEPESSYVPPPPAPVKKAIAAKWFPFGLKAPLLLDGTLAGDAGFDPLGLGSSSTKSLYWMADAEVKHARLAMLAAVGWCVGILRLLVPTPSVCDR